MVKYKKRILIVVSVLMFLFTSLCLVGCAGEDNESAYITVEGIVASQDITLNEALANATFTYDVPEGAYDEEEGKPAPVVATGLAAMRTAGVSVIWSGSSEDEIAKNEGIIFQFAFRGEVKSILIAVS